MEIIFTYRETKPYRIKVTVMEVGNELIAIVEGGDKPHIGSIAIAIPCFSLKDSSSTSSTVSVYNLVGHKDDRIASPLADLITRTFNRVTVVLAGIHIDQATEQDIARILMQMPKINNKIISKLKKCYKDCK